VLTSNAGTIGFNEKTKCLKSRNLLQNDTWYFYDYTGQPTVLCSVELLNVSDRNIIFGENRGWSWLRIFDDRFEMPMNVGRRVNADYDCMSILNSYITIKKKKSPQYIDTIDEIVRKYIKLFLFRDI